MSQILPIREYSYNHFHQQLNYVYDIKETVIDEEFVRFNFQKISSKFLFFINLCFTFLLLPLTIISLFLTNIYDISPLAIFLYYLGFIASLVGTVCGWILYFLHKNVTSPSKIGEKSRFWRLFDYENWNNYQLPIQHWYLISIHLFCMEKFLRLRFLSNCSIQHNDNGFLREIESWNCNRNDHITGIPGDSSLILLLFPFICLIAIKESRWWFTVSCHVIVMTLFLFAYSKQISGSLLVIVVIWLVGGCILFLDLHQDHLKMFFITKKLKATLDEKEMNAEQIQVNEMRHLIGNVAHDLKTVNFFQLLSLRN